MRPHKHVTASREDAQEIFDISIARLGERPGVPFAATSESEEITLYGWDEPGGTWRAARVKHAPITTVRDVPSISNTWNWSRRVGLCTFDHLVYLVYKGAEAVAAGQEPEPARLVVEVFRMEPPNSPEQVMRIPVPMPSYTVESNDFPPTLSREFEKPGFELWAGVDRRRRRLLIVTQTLGEDATAVGGNAKLMLLIGDLGRLDQTDAWDYRTLDDGGYGLDVRHEGDTLTLVYRVTPESVRVPLPSAQIDPFFSPPQPINIDASSESDSFFEPLRVMRIDLESLTNRTLDLPGGEHPRIQNVEPLMIVADKPQLRVQFRLVASDQGADREVEPRIDWEIRSVHKVAYLLDNQNRVARGVLMSIPQLNRRPLPRTVSPWVNVQDLFQITPQTVGWASTWPRFPLEPLRFNDEPRQPSLDFLHKAAWFALLRARARFATDFEEGVLTVTELNSTVYDLNHEQMARPDADTPDTNGENAHFSPFEELSQQSGPFFLAPNYRCDNTIGGSLITDREGVAYRFVSYIDLGDGGLRVIYDADLRPPDQPPPVEKPKVLEPETVSGPGSGDERWIELVTTDWQDAKVPAIGLLSLISQPTITSSVHSQIESLLTAAHDHVVPSLVMDEDGWTDIEVNSIQSAINNNLPGEPAVIFSTDGTVPRAFIEITPAGVAADANFRWNAGIEGETVAGVFWRFTFVFPTGQQSVINASGNPATLTLFASGNWTVRADIARSDGTVRTFETVVEVGPSLFRLISGTHRQLARRGLDPPLSNFGNYRIGTATFNLLQYQLRFPVAAGARSTKRIIIESLETTDAQWRFQANESEQGQINYRLRIKFDSTDFRLRGLLNSLVTLDRVRASFFYGRAFTPGILMNDTRSAVPVSGAEQLHDGLRLTDESASVPRLASALTTRPIDSSLIEVESVKADVSMLSQAVFAAAVTLLVGLGAMAAAMMLLFLLALLGVAVATAALPFAGVAAAAAVVAATAAVFLFISMVVPPLVESGIEDSVKQGLESDDSKEDLDESRLLQFAGEGIAEAIARQVIEEANHPDETLDPPPESPELIGADRRRQHLYQMIHVSEGRCRVLIRE